MSELLLNIKSIDMKKKQKKHKQNLFLIMNLNESLGKYPQCMNQPQRRRQQQQ